MMRRRSTERLVGESFEEMMARVAAEEASEDEKTEAAASGSIAERRAAGDAERVKSAEGDGDDSDDCHGRVPVRGLRACSSNETAPQAKKSHKKKRGSVSTEPAKCPKERNKRSVPPGGAPTAPRGGQGGGGTLQVAKAVTPTKDSKGGGSGRNCVDLEQYAVNFLDEYAKASRDSVFFDPEKSQAQIRSLTRLPYC